MIFALDLEGVLAPELWPILADHFDVPELQLTTRDVASFEDLMQRRVEATRKRGLTLRDLQAVTHQVQPYLGTRDLLTRLRAMGQVIIISDTFHELAEPLVERLGGHNLFANQFETDSLGFVTGFRLRIRGRKERLVTGFQGAGFRVAAAGDSLNDLTLLRSCDFPVLYRPVEALVAEFPNAPVATHADELLEHLTLAWRTKREPETV
jgi:phosphoserine/homoserine phosphotransferase